MTQAGPEEFLPDVQPAGGLPPRGGPGVAPPRHHPGRKAQAGGHSGARALLLHRQLCRGRQGSAQAGAVDPGGIHHRPGHGGQGRFSNSFLASVNRKKICLMKKKQRFFDIIKHVIY